MFFSAPPLPMRTAVLLPALVMLACLAACQPAVQQAQQRVDFALDAQGRCQVGDQPVDCAQAGTTARSRYPTQTLNAVLRLDPKAPDTARAALLHSLEAARIDRLQFGEPGDRPTERRIEF
ncbi:hypothetical protein [Ideonella livida]|uniref:DUF4156 domain-containing protein n=1 Tax=Ideonella livida TaxID=2707176 RepID=A0A7C9TNA1_9BURK|nr:hypothetical protein [Ideonella livida]NDY93285.1 hypothetical protein [Ideonella livida]